MWESQSKLQMFPLVSIHSERYNFQWYPLLNYSSSEYHISPKLWHIVYLLLFYTVLISWLNLLIGEQLYFLLAWEFSLLAWRENPKFCLTRFCFARDYFSLCQLGSQWKVKSQAALNVVVFSVIFSRGYANHRNNYLLGDRICKCVTHSDVNFWWRTWTVWIRVSCGPPKLKVAILVLVVRFRGSI